MVDADFAPQPIPAPAVRLPDSAHNGTTLLQGNNSSSISVQVGQSQHPFEYWPQNETSFPKPLLSEEVTQPKDEALAETSSEESSRAGAVLNSVEEYSSGVEDKNVGITPESIVVNNGSHLVGLENCVTDTGVLVEEREVEFISQESGRGIATSATIDEDKVEDVIDTNQAVPDSVAGHSSELVSAPATLPSSNAAVLIEESLETCNEDSLCGQSEPSDHDYPSELYHEDGNSENVPLDEEETGCVDASLVESREVERDVRLVKPAADINVKSDVPEVKPISFQLDEDLSDSEVNRYLEELEEEESKDSDESSNENDANEVSSSVQEDEGNVEEAEPVDESQEVETDEVEDEEVIPKGTLTKEIGEEPVRDDSSPKRSVVAKVQTNTADSTVEEQNLGTGMESEASADGSNMECVKEEVPSENVVGEKAMSGEDRGCKVEGMEGTEVLEKSSNVRKAVEDSRVESWVVEGSGKLLEGASVNERVSAANKSSESVSVTKQESRSGMPVRPDTLSISALVGSVGNSSVDEEDSIPIPLVLGSARSKGEAKQVMFSDGIRPGGELTELDRSPTGMSGPSKSPALTAVQRKIANRLGKRMPGVVPPGPPGATPANPRPPSDIGARMSVNEIPVKLEAKVQAETELPQEHPSHLSTLSQLESDSMSEAIGTRDEADPQIRSEQIPVSAPEESLSHEIGDHKHPEEDRPVVPDSIEDSTPDSGDGTPLPGEIPSGNEVDEQNVASGVASNSEFQDSAASSSPNEEAGCTALALGDVAPFWVPDADAPSCMSCAIKFTLIKRRHHCRACGKVLCSKCCSSKAKLTYMKHSEARVCLPCFGILQEAASGGVSPTGGGRYHPSHGGEEGTSSDHSPRRRHTRPDPNNPMEYCSTVPPLEQVGERARAPPPTVMVPVGVLKREGPVISGPMSQLPTVASRIPDDALPPLVDKSTGSCVGGGEYNFEEGPDLEKLMETLRDDSEPPVAFALSTNFFVLVKIITR
ncbi:hypothetical protein J437_LFUL011859 [Ladona fulva]|uniref:FYVE-type domain-containing protein n=1 Tax=Ladona fulva TaxID=123851 RepID=A0A8K0KGG5_LADFU|nr:hypothetical protein J437_LFUL011859 [Ladona fulva]